MKFQKILENWSYFPEKTQIEKKGKKERKKEKVGQDGIRTRKVEVTSAEGCCH